MNEATAIREWIGRAQDDIERRSEFLEGVKAVVADGERELFDHLDPRHARVWEWASFPSRAGRGSEDEQIDCYLDGLKAFADLVTKRNEAAVKNEAKQVLGERPGAVCAALLLRLVDIQHFAALRRLALLAPADFDQITHGLFGLLNEEPDEEESADSVQVQVGVVMETTPEPSFDLASQLDQVRMVEDRAHDVAQWLIRAMSDKLLQFSRTRLKEALETLHSTSVPEDRYRIAQETVSAAMAGLRAEAENWTVVAVGMDTVAQQPNEEQQRRAVDEPLYPPRLIGALQNHRDLWDAALRLSEPRMSPNGSRGTPSFWQNRQLRDAVGVRSWCHKTYSRWLTAMSKKGFLIQERHGRNRNTFYRVNPDWKEIIRNVPVDRRQSA